MKPIKTLGVMTSGGDCAGLNAAIRAVTLHATQTYGWRVLGIHDGTLGLMEQPRRYTELHADAFTGRLLREGGTVLGTTTQGDPFRFPMPDGSLRDRSDEFAAGVRELDLDALVVIGGDGSMRILARLCEYAGLGMVGIPKTIDNDVHGTMYAIGFMTAVNVVTDALDHLQPTAASHHRVMILETMGRDAGHIALSAGVAGGADVILIPELRYTLDGVAAHLGRVMQRGTHALMVVAEGVRTEDGRAVIAGGPEGHPRYGGIGHHLMQEISARSGAVARVTVLGHVQRGGVPSAIDRLLASGFGVHAVDLAAQGRFGRMTVWQAGGVADLPLSEVTIGARCVAQDDPLIETARALGIYVGEAR